MIVFSRYQNDGLQFSGKGLRSAKAVNLIRTGISLGVIPVIDTVVVKQGVRLDLIAAKYYNDARYWWVLAAASNIGWSPQVPPETLVVIPDLSSVEKVIG